MEEKERERLRELGNLVFDQWARRNQSPDAALSHIKYSENIISAGMVVEADGQFYEVYEENGEMVAKPLPR